MEIKLHEIVEVSNNSRLTQDLLNTLNTKLSKSEKDDFRRFLELVKNKSNTSSGFHASCSNKYY